MQSTRDRHAFNRPTTLGAEADARILAAPADVRWRLGRVDNE
jgi:hypothetical protein